MEITTQESFDRFMSNQTNQITDSIETDDETDEFGASINEDEAITTFRMLLEKMSQKDRDFIEICQYGGLIARNPPCTKCLSPMVLAEGEQYIDGLEWCCPNCSHQQSVRLGSWYAEIETCRLKDALLIMYCWSRDYSETACEHELESLDRKAVPTIYTKCHLLTQEYFRHDISSIGSKGEPVEIDQFTTSTGIQIIGGVEVKNIKNIFFRVLPENWTRDELVTALVDNIAPQTIIHFKNSTLLEILDKEGLEYLERVWDFTIETAPSDETKSVVSLGSIFEKQFLCKGFTECRLMECLFRRRMEGARDPFLFLLSVVSLLHPVPQGSS